MVEEIRDAFNADSHQKESKGQRILRKKVEHLQVTYDMQHFHLSVMARLSSISLALDKCLL